MSKRSVILSLVCLLVTLTSCGVKPKSVEGVVTNLEVRTTISVEKEKETMKYGLTTVPFGGEVKKRHFHIRTLKVCGTSKSKSSSSSGTTKKSSTTSKPKSSGINLKKDSPTSSSTTKKSNSNRPSTTNVTPAKPCTSKTETYYTYDVEVESWMHYQTFTSNSFEVPSVPSHLYNDDDYQVGNPITTCTVMIPSENLDNLNVDCEVWKTLKEGQSIKGTVMGNQLTLL